MNLLFTLLLLLANSASLEVTLTVTVKNLPTSTGMVSIGIYDNPDMWLEDAPYGGKVNVSDDQSATIEVTGLAPGIYGLSFHHDANGNGEMDYNFVGYPKEAFGFSAGAQAVFKAPEFEEATLEILEDMSVTLYPQ